MKQVTLKRLVTLVLAFCLLPLIPSPRVVSAQGEMELGAATEGKNAYEFIAQVDQNALALTGVGYVTHISGLTDDQLFSEKDVQKWSAQTARLTFSVTARLDSRFTLENVINTASTGTLVFYFNEKPPADFKNPKSFSSGTPVATFAIRLQNMLTVTDPDTGLAMGTAELRQQDSTPFTLNGKAYRFGHEGLLQRMTTFGSGKRTQALLPQAHFVFAGNSLVIAKP
jgi:hypothetical protein